MKRHPYEWPIVAGNQWPNHGRELTGRYADVYLCAFTAPPDGIQLAAGWCFPDSRSEYAGTQ